MGERRTGHRPRPLEVLPKAQEGLRLGMSYAMVCKYVGISERTFYSWMARGEGRDKERPQTPELVRFVQGVKEAEGEGCAAMLSRVVIAANSGVWQAAAWILERRFHKDFSRRVYRPEDEHKSDAVTVVFNRPAVDPEAVSDDLTAAPLPDNDTGGNGG